MPLRWEKVLSRSDAQVQTTGWPVPYIRLTRSNHPQDTQTWFRHTFFAGVPWQPGHFGDHAVEEANVAFEVTLPGQATQTRQLMITHDDSRGQTGKSTPNTWVHWDDATRDELRATGYDGRRIVLERSNTGVFSLTIT
jgi:hypothetical protein